MEYNGSIFSPASMPWENGGQRASSSEQYSCAPKVIEMLSRAIRHQEDLLDLLVMSESLETRNPHDSDISPPILRAIEAKIGNSMDWCYLALRSLREMEVHNNSSKVSSPESFAQDSLLSTTSYSKSGDGPPKKKKQQQPKRQDQLESPSSARMNVVPPLLSPLPVQAGTQWDSGNLLFRTPQVPTHGLYPGEDSTSLQQRRRRWRHQQQGQNFARLLANLHMDTAEWPLIQGEASPMSAFVPTAPLFSSADDRANIDDEVKDRLCSKSKAAFPEDQSCISKTPPIPLLRGNRTRHGSGKSEARKWSEGDAKLEKVFQTLNDSKKAIPDDGHRGWKKYGNKTIQNSNHCRGYYKCSAKECRAKKMVQPTDKDPTLFEVTYVGKHSCNSSSTGHRRRSVTRSTPAEACNLDPPAAVEAPALQRTHKSAGMIDNMLFIGSNAVTEEDFIRENAGCMGIIPGKRARAMAEDEKKASLDNFSYLHTMTTSTTTTTATSASEEQVGADSMADTFLRQSSENHHQDAYSFQEPLLWPDLDMDTSLATGHKSVSDSP